VTWIQSPLLDVLLLVIFRQHIIAPDSDAGLAHLAAGKLTARSDRLRTVAASNGAGRRARSASVSLPAAIHPDADQRKAPHTPR
jgi:hypothetical protein